MMRRILAFLFATAPVIYISGYLVIRAHSYAIGIAPDLILLGVWESDAERVFRSSPSDPSDDEKLVAIERRMRNFHEIFRPLVWIDEKITGVEIIDPVQLW